MHSNTHLQLVSAPHPAGTGQILEEKNTGSEKQMTRASIKAINSNPKREEVKSGKLDQVCEKRQRLR